MAERKIRKAGDLRDLPIQVPSNFVFILRQPNQPDQDDVDDLFLDMAPVFDTSGISGDNVLWWQTVTTTSTTSTTSSSSSTSSTASTTSSSSSTSSTASSTSTQSTTSSSSSTSSTASTTSTISTTSSTEPGATSTSSTTSSSSTSSTASTTSSTASTSSTSSTASTTSSTASTTSTFSSTSSTSSTAPYVPTGFTETFPGSFPAWGTSSYYLKVSDHLGTQNNSITYDSGDFGTNCVEIDANYDEGIGLQFTDVDALPAGYLRFYIKKATGDGGENVWFRVLSDTTQIVGWQNLGAAPASFTQITPVAVPAVAAGKDITLHFGAGDAQIVILVDTVEWYT